MLFEQAGLEVVPYPVDFWVSAGKNLTVTDFLPQAECLKKTEAGLREVYWFLFYRIIGL